MRTINQTLENFTVQYPLERIAPLDKLLFIDIETTGFTAKSSSLYLIGAAYYYSGRWHIKQWLATNYEDEKALLDDFFPFAADFTHLIHFNGNNFDLPYLLQKCEMYKLPYHFDDFEGIDIYKRIFPYKFFLHTPNCKQKTLEELLGIDREDIYNGGELIGIYHEYVKNPTEEACRFLLLHNSDDMKGMLQILPLLAFYDLFNGPLKAKKVQSNRYVDYHGHDKQELLMKLELPTPLPLPIANLSNGCYFSGESNEGILKVPVYEEEMKYFYSNYKDYYYLPEEDVALHKSVASFVDKTHRVQAAASTCYTRKYSTYLPQWDIFMEPFFKRDYKSKDLFFELTDEIKKNRELFSRYAQYLLGKMAKTY
ncbi:MAG: ribonuclease H-like domain-containing protein [Lachnospiraceae bacterium]|nr:ribonuclease H-like domain-containing protein [Lachnospiraceae bacterium]